MTSGRFVITTLCAARVLYKKTRSFLTSAAAAAASMTQSIDKVRDDCVVFIFLVQTLAREDFFIYLCAFSYLYWNHTLRVSFY